MKASLENILLAVSKSPKIDLGEIDRAAELIIQACCQGLNIGRVGIWLLQENGIRCAYLFDNGDWLDTEPLVLKQEQFPNYFNALYAERTIKADDAETHPSTAEFTHVYLRPHDIKSMLDVPIRHQGKMVGIVCCEQRGECKYWTPDEVVFTSTLADLCGRAMNAHERNILQDELENINKNLEEIIKARTIELEYSIEELKRTQEKLIENEKLARLGQLVAGVAHEINTPLGTALTAISCAKDLLPELLAYRTSAIKDEEAFTQNIKKSNDALDLGLKNLFKVSGLVSDFKLVAADESNLAAEKLQLADFLDHLSLELASVFDNAGIRLERDFDPGLGLTTYPRLLTQVITCLVDNAITHAFDKVTLPTIHLSCQQHAQGVEILFQDNGVGIPEKHLDKIFEPFFTTTRFRGGTGLGLTIIYNIVNKQLSGDITVASTQGKGTEFSIRLPLSLP